MSAGVKKKVVGNEASWKLISSTVELYVTEKAGMLAPLVFDRKGRKIQPFGLAPWVKEKVPAGLPPLLKVLRGDFFCMPFGGNDKPFRGENHPPHGETANAKWKFKGLDKADGKSTLHLRMETRVRKATVDKEIALVDGQDAVYCRHTISGMKGPMSFGHHPMLKFPDKPGCGAVSTSPIRYGMVAPLPFEDPENKGYFTLKTGSKFKDLSRVQTISGDYADLTRYPARRGFEDLVMLVSKPQKPFAWTAVAFPGERFVWFALRDPKILKHTLLWMSNGGRHYEPWNGRHVNVMGIEEVTSYFHYGLTQSVKSKNMGVEEDRTFLDFTPDRPVAVNYIMAVAPIPRTFDRVKTIEPAKAAGKVELVSYSGKSVCVSLDHGFLAEQPG